MRHLGAIGKSYQRSAIPYIFFDEGLLNAQFWKDCSFLIMSRELVNKK